MSSISKKLVEGVAYTSLGNMLIKFLSFLGYVLILMKLSMHDYGIFVLLTALSGPFVAIVFFGADRLFASSLAKLRGGNNIAGFRGLAFDYYITVSMLSLAVLTFAFIFEELVVSHYKNVYLSQFMPQVAFFIVSQSIFNAVLLFLEATEEFKKSSFALTIESFSRGSMVLASIARLDVGMLLIIYGAAKLIASSAGLITARKGLHEYLFSSAIIRERGVLIRILKGYGKWELAKNLVGQLAKTFELWIIKIFANVQSVAVYDFALKFYSVSASLFPVKGVLFPIISRSISDRELVMKMVAKSKKYSLIFYTFAYCAIAFSLPVMIPLLFKQYEGQLLAILFVMAHLLVDIYGIGRVPIVYGLNEQKYIVKIMPLTFFLEIFLNISLTRYFGLIGSIFSWHLNAVILNFLISSHLKRKYRLNFWDFGQILSFDQYDKLILNKFLRKLRIKELHI